jgi:hypothetical protein
LARDVIELRRPRRRKAGRGYRIGTARNRCLRHGQTPSEHSGSIIASSTLLLRRNTMDRFVGETVRRAIVLGNPALASYQTELGHCGAQVSRAGVA